MTKDKEYAALLNKQIAEIGKEVRSLEFKSNYQDADRLGNISQHYQMELVLIMKRLGICISVLRMRLWNSVAPPLTFHVSRREGIRTWKYFYDSTLLRR